MASDETVSEVRRVCSILERMAALYAPESEEATAIADAASAYILVHQQESLSAAWQQLKSAYHGSVPDDVVERMRTMGIDTNELDRLE